VFDLIARTLKRQHEGGDPLIQGGEGNIKLGTGGSSQVSVLFLATGVVFNYLDAVHFSFILTIFKF
jgi:hypothetical protein